MYIYLIRLKNSNRYLTKQSSIFAPKFAEKTSRIYVDSKQAKYVAQRTKADVEVVEFDLRECDII